MKLLEERDGTTDCSLKLVLGDQQKRLKFGNLVDNLFIPCDDNSVPNSGSDALEEPDSRLTFLRPACLGVKINVLCTVCMFALYWID